MNLTASRQRKCFRYTATFVSSILCSCWELRLASQTLRLFFLREFLFTHPELLMSQEEHCGPKCWQIIELTSVGSLLSEILSPQTLAAKVSLQYLKNLFLPFVSCLAFWDFSVGEWSATNYFAIIRGRNLTFSFCSKEAEVWRK